jgi:hypothetical protein
LIASAAVIELPAMKAPIPIRHHAAAREGPGGAA